MTYQVETRPPWKGGAAANKDINLNFEELIDINTGFLRCQSNMNQKDVLITDYIES